MDNFVCNEGGDYVLVNQSNGGTYRNAPMINGVVAIVLLHPQHHHFTTLLRGRDNQWFCSDDGRLKKVNVHVELGGHVTLVRACVH